MNKIIDQLKTSSSIIKTDNTHPFILNNKDDIWYIEKGKVDIFAIKHISSNILGHRVHLCRMVGGETIFGLGKNTSLDLDFIQLYAVGLPDTEVIMISRQGINQILQQEDGTIELTKWINNWQRKIGEQILTLEESTTNEIDVISGIKQNNVFEKLDIFNHYCLDKTTILLKNEASEDKNHLKNKSEAELKNLDRELHHLAYAISPEKREESVISETGNALIDACYLVAKNMGIRINISHLKLKDYTIEQILKESYLVMRQVALTSVNWWNENNGPLLAFMIDDKRPVALLPTAFNEYVLIDTTKNLKIKVTQEIASKIDTSALMFFKQFPEKSIKLKELVSFCFNGTMSDLYRLSIMGAMAGLLSIAIPYATGILFNTIIPANQFNQLVQIIILLVVATIGIAIFQVTSSIALLRIEGKVSVASQAAMIDRLFNLPAPFFRNFSSGDLTQRVFAIDNIMQLITGTAQTTILAGIFSLFSLIYMFFISISLALLATFLVFISMSLFVYLNYRRLSYERHFTELQGDVLNRNFQLLNGIAKLRIAGAEIRAFILWIDSFNKKITTNILAQRIGNYLTVVNGVLIITTSLFIFWFISAAHINISTGDFLAFNTAFIQFALAMIALSSVLTSSINAIPLYERAKPILHTLPEVTLEKEKPGELQGEIEISHISFRYHSDSPLVLKDITLTIHPGEFIAFVGASSSGKSTLLRILLGLEKPESGAIFYDGKNLENLDIQAVRQQIGVVIQNAKLLPGSIFTNIVGSSLATMDDAWEAARLAGFENDVKAMPMGMNTFLSEGTATISGGQRQRLLIARAIVNKPNILLFDEASSALDNITQATVTNSLAKLNATRIIIAHRLSTIINADRIFLIDNGEVIESGTFDELMEKRGRFAELAKRQIVH